MTALFALRDKSYKKHTGVLAAVNRELVHAGEWNKESGAAYNSLFEIRTIGDYGGVDQVSTSEATTAVERAQMIINAVAETCSELDVED